MSLTAVEREHIREQVSLRRQTALRRPHTTASKDTRAPQTVIEAQIDALHFGLVEIRQIIEGYGAQLAQIRAETLEQRVTKKWLEAERQIFALRQRVAELEAS